MNEFKLDEEIEMSSLKEFECPITVKFVHQDPQGMFWGIDKHGNMYGRTYARKVASSVIAIIYDKDYRLGYSIHQIPQELADKIKEFR